MRNDVAGSVMILTEQHRGRPDSLYADSHCILMIRCLDKLTEKD